VSGLPSFTLIQLAYFVCAAEERSMTAAALKTRVAQSAVSMAVSNLERELGVQLFIRQRAKGVALTAAGERFLQQARAVLAHANDAAEIARGLGAEVAGDLRVGCFVTLAPFHIPRILSDVATEHPLLRVEVIEGEMDQLQTGLRSGHCDLALCYDLDLPEGFHRELVGVVPPHVVLPADHRLAAATGVRIADLVNEPMILLDLPHSRDYFRSIAATTGVEPQVVYRSSSYETVRGLVAQGRGFSILNQIPAADITYDGGRVVTKPLLDPFPPLPIVLCWLNGVRLTARAQAFAARCRTVLYR
jgi:DNA-binding transcriptional LysR family regulator